MSHITLKLLRVVAENDDLIFTGVEYVHLVKCPECFLGWSQVAAEGAGISTLVEDGLPGPEN
jgi:hypothetical protein